ncbi:hypothetical protein OHC33_008377 [Knufia fluminis]|uniref:Uncharacterized protein n=1 Tax=Knufia fluminis TaxID=191047 RepID=A0AAN8EC80_9EURO|nr:hypothetical protein OHC33_008377 [Knufia fluminis]
MAQEAEERYISPVARIRSQLSRNSSNEEEDNISEGTGKGAGSKRQPTKTSTGLRSEGGHDIYKIKPMTKHSGSNVVTFFNGLFQTIIAISTLGTSVTFSFILTSNTELSNPNAYYNTSQVATFLAVSWLLFLLALTFGSLGSTLLTFFKAHWIRDWDGEHGRRSQKEVQFYAVLASGLLGAQIIGAFVFLCLVAVAYSPVVGWIALAFTGWFGILIMVSVLWQVPWPWRDNEPDTRSKSP